MNEVPVRTGGRAPDLWDFLTTLVASRRLFLSIYGRYEARVIEAARERRVDRTKLMLPPRELWALFHQGRLEHLRDGRLAPLRTLARRVFGDKGDEGLMDAYCTHIYHEISILCEEHRSVGRFVRHHDPRRYRDLFREVSGYYPMRLRRVRRFFIAAMKRLDELLPRWSEERILIRSIYLFGGPLSRRAWGRPQAALYQRMYPKGGEIRGYLEAARSFSASGFTSEANRALGHALKSAERHRQRRDLMTDEQQALEEVQGMMANMLGAAGSAEQPAPRATRT